MKLQQLKEIAAKLNFTYKGNVSATKLEQMLRDYCEHNDQSFDELVQETDMEEKTEEIVTFESLENSHKNKAHTNAQREALKLVRCIVTCNNRNKSAYNGEIFSVCNASVPEVKKFIQFGTPYHVPQIILNAIKEKKMNVYRKERRPNGDLVTVANEVPEYNIQILDALTPEELESIKKKQLAEGFNGE